MNSYIFTADGISLYLNGKPMNAEKSHPNYNKVLDAIRNDAFDTIPDLLDVGSAITNYGHGLVEVVDGEVLYKGQPLRNYLVDHILNMMYEGFNIDPMIAYLTNLMQNPSKRAVDELHKFNEYGKMPVTEDGCFIAYKRINGWYDTHSGTVFNKPYALFDGSDFAAVPYTTKQGVTVEIVDGLTTISMERNMVDDKAENTCSQGLHFCSQEYLRSFSGDKIVVLKINPADVVSIPVDYNNTKGRCWKYQVLDVLSQEDFNRAMNVNIFTQPVYTSEEEPDVWVEVTEEQGWSDYKVETQDNPAPSAFIVGYSAGYADGRRKVDNSYAWSGAGLDGYLEGRKDGRGHKPKQYT